MTAAAASSGPPANLNALVETLLEIKRQAVIGSDFSLQSMPNIRANWAVSQNSEATIWSIGNDAEIGVKVDGNLHSFPIQSLLLIQTSAHKLQTLVLRIERLDERGCLTLHQVQKLVPIGKWIQTPNIPPHGDLPVADRWNLEWRAGEPFPGKDVFSAYFTFDAAKAIPSPDCMRAVTLSVRG